MKRKEFLKTFAKAIAASAFISVPGSLMALPSKRKPNEVTLYSLELDKSGASLDTMISTKLNKNDLKKGDEFDVKYAIEYVYKDVWYTAWCTYKVVDSKVEFRKVNTHNVKLIDFTQNRSRFVTFEWGTVREKMDKSFYKEDIKLLKKVDNITFSIYEDTVSLRRDGEEAFLLKGRTEGCFLTSACTKSRGLPDNCTELQTLRKFRDQYMMNSHEGAAMVREYYKIAPPVVSAINSLEQQEEVWDFIYRELVSKSIELIESNQHALAMYYYHTFTMELHSRFIEKSL